MVVPGGKGGQPAQVVWNKGFGSRGKAIGRLLKSDDRGLKIAVPETVEAGEYITVRPLGDQRESGRQRRRSLRARVTSCEPIGVSNDHLLLAQPLTTARSHVAHVIDWIIPWVALAMCVLAVANVAFLKRANASYFWYQPIANLYGILVSLYIISRIVLAVFYRPPKLTDCCPPVTAVIACKNEEDSIFKTIDRLYACDYPAEKLQVIAVNDGSTDNTQEEMERARERHPVLEIITFEKNLGKRHGMAAGARNATGDILFYVDSDSFLHRDAIRRMASHFENPDIGAVCGHARVSNAKRNLITKMQEVRYYTAFRIVKAAESLFSAVTCCSGCLAAYRRKYVMEFLDTWLNQRFLGTEATFGDDRSMTNNILRRYKVIYDSEAICETIVPESLRTFLRQQIRWKKSWIRESLRAWRFMWRKSPPAAFLFYLGTLFPLVAPLVVSNALLLPVMGLGNFSYLYVYGALLMTMLYGLVYLGKHRCGLWIYGVAFSIFYMAILVWLTYYALFTLRRNHWGTR